MDFDKTSFSVDWFTPGDKYAPKRLSFPKSARISIDDLVSDSPLGFCFNPVDEAFGWTNSAPPSPPVPSDRERIPMYDQDPKPCEDTPTDWRVLASLGLLSVVDDCAMCGVNLDVSCLDTLDEQLLLSPLESFAELCWAIAVHDEDTAPAISTRNRRFRARSFKSDHERAFPPPLARDYPGSFERARPSAAKMTLPLETFPHFLSYPSELLNTSPMRQEKTLESIHMYNGSEGRPLALPAHIAWRSKKRDFTLTPSFESLAHSQPSTSCLPPSKSGHTFRVISDAYSTLARARKSRH